MKPSQSILAVFALVAATTVAAQDAQPKQSAPPGGQSSGATVKAPQAATGVAAGTALTGVLAAAAASAISRANGATTTTHH
jgi:hypothetical protein